MFKFSALLFFVSVSVPALLVSANYGQPIHPDGDKTKCLDVRGANFADGTPVQIFDCNGSNAQMWDIMPGNTAVKVHGQNFCLDAGSEPANGVPMKIWECFDGLPAQTWFYTGDQRIALLGQGFCLDLTNGAHVDSNLVQTWTCTDNNSNQIWTLDA
ncbi:Endo-1,4-beta-xylanase A [Termitomyces sp. J132]|nr:Endo-1,4-beta-xylanase A [Termitomyces sp. J132]